jgi:calcineurin-like phosphoesterase family protein
MSRVFVCADHHFGHENIIGYCRRPYKNAQQMDRRLVQRHNEVVAPEDTVLFLGDVTMHGPEKIDWLRGIIQSMHGTKHLIFGNHDRLKWHQYLDVGFATVHSYLEQDAVVETNGSGALPARFRTYRNVTVNMCHDPAWAQDPSRLWVCGHLHNNYFTAPSHIAIVSVELTEYRPVLLTKIIDGFRPGADAVRVEPRLQRNPDAWKEVQR